MMPDKLSRNQKCAIRQIFDKHECLNAMRIKICRTRAQRDGNPEMNRSSPRDENEFMK